MGNPAPMKLFVLALTVCVIVGAHASDEVEALEAMGEGDRAIAEHAEVLMQLGMSGPSSHVVGLTRKIKALQTDIKGIRAKKAGHVSKSDKAKTGGKMKKHINNGAAAKDLDAQLHQKNHELASLTIKQHEAAAGGATDAPAETPVDTSAADTDSGSDSNGLFGGWMTKWTSMHTQMQSFIKELQSHTAKLKGQSDKQHTEVKAHMEKVKKAYDKEEKARKVAQKKAKEFAHKKAIAEAAERKAKAAEKATKKEMKAKIAAHVEKKTKAIEKHKKQEVKTKTEENKEKEMKAKAEIKRLLALNAKIKKDCERNKKIAKKKADERWAKEHARAVALAKKVAALQKEINTLKAALAVAQAEIKKQVALKKSWMTKEKTQKERTAKAEAKVKVLTQKLKVVTAKFNKMKKTMSHINVVSDKTKNPQA